MSKTFEIIERVGISTESTDEAIKNALLDANQEKKVAWFEVLDQRGRLTSEGKVEFQVTLKIGRKTNN